MVAFVGVVVAVVFCCCFTRYDSCDFALFPYRVLAVGVLFEFTKSLVCMGFL